MSDESALAIRVAGADWALPLAVVKELIDLREPVPVPGAPAHVRGLISHRGEIIALIDASQLEQGRPCRGGAIVVLEPRPRIRVALLVEEVRGVTGSGARRFNLERLFHA